MKKRIMRIMALVVMMSIIIGTQLQVTAASHGSISEHENGSFLTEDDEQAVMDTVTSVLSAATEIPMTRTLNNVSSAVEQDIQAKALAFAALEQRIGASFTQVYHNIDIYDVRHTNRGTYSMNVYDATVVWYDYPDLNEEPDFFVYGVWHEMELFQNNSIWCVIKDSFDERDVTGAASRDVILSEENVAKYDSSKEKLAEERGLVSISFSYSTSSLNNALHYATQYCGFSDSQKLNHGYTDMNSDSSTSNYNFPTYVYWSGLDCCNFVSQILCAAGVPTDSTWQYITNGTYAWFNVVPFTSYFGGSFNVSSVNFSNYSNIYPGNPVYWLLSENGSIGATTNHIMFCVGYNSSGVPVLCGHTTDIFRYPLSSFSDYNMKTIQIATYNMHSHSYGFKCTVDEHYIVCNHCENCASHGAHIANQSGICKICGASVSPQ